MYLESRRQVLRNLTGCLGFCVQAAQRVRVWLTAHAWAAVSRRGKVKDAKLGGSISEGQVGDGWLLQRPGQRSKGKSVCLCTGLHPTPFLTPQNSLAESPTTTRFTWTLVQG